MQVDFHSLTPASKTLRDPSSEKSSHIHADCASNVDPSEAAKRIAKVPKEPESRQYSSLAAFWRSILETAEESRKIAVNLMLSAHEAKYKELKNVETAIRDEAEKTREADNTRGSLGMVSGVTQVACAGYSGLSGAKSQKLEHEAKCGHQSARLNRDSIQRQALKNHARECSEQAIAKNKHSVLARAGGEFAGSLFTSSGNLGGAAASHEATQCRADQKRNEAHASQSDAQLTSTGQFLQQSQQFSNSQIQQYQEFLREKNQMERIAMRVV